MKNRIIPHRAPRQRVAYRLIVMDTTTCAGD
jgi:hypothetical protein